MKTPREMLKNLKKTVVENGGIGGVIDSMIAPIAPGWALQRQQTRNAFNASSEYYRGAARNRLRADWTTRTTKPDAPKWEQNTLVARSRDIERNDPVGAGLIDTMGINVVGKGLRPQSKIRSEVLGCSEEQADEYRTMAESAFEAFCKNADAREISTFDHLQFMALMQICRDGESVALPVWSEKPHKKFARAIQLLEREMLGNPMAADEEKARGIIYGSMGEPLKYLINKDPAKSVPDFEEIDARDSRGRKKVIHAFMPRRPGQSRGIPLFAPVMDLFKDLGDYREAEIIKARIAACLSVIFTKADPVSAAHAARETGTKLGARDEQITRLSPGMVHYAEYGDDVKIVDPNRGQDVFGVFSENILRLIGASIGLPYELVLKDFSKTNYSSARAALLEGRRVFTFWRSWFGDSFCKPFYELVLEEAYYRGYFKVPRFFEFFDEYCRCAWLGSGWGWVDPVKEITASKLAIDYNLSSHEIECAAQGVNAYEILDDQDNYMKYRGQKQHLPEAVSADSKTATQSQPENNESEKQNANAD